MRVESLTSRLEFNERRARALESVVVYKPAESKSARQRRSPGAHRPRRSRAAVQSQRARARAARRRHPRRRRAGAGRPSAEPTRPDSRAGRRPGQRSRRRRRRRGRRGGGSAAAVMGTPGRRRRAARRLDRAMARRTDRRRRSPESDEARRSRPNRRSRGAGERRADPATIAGARSRRRRPSRPAAARCRSGPSSRGRPGPSSSSERRIARRPAACPTTRSEARGRRPALRPGDQRRRRAARALHRRAPRAPRRGRGADDVRHRLRHLAERAAAGRRDRSTASRSAGFRVKHERDPARVRPAVRARLRRSRTRSPTSSTGSTPRDRRSPALVDYIAKHAAELRLLHLLQLPLLPRVPRRARRGARARSWCRRPSATPAIGLSIFQPVFRGVRALMYNSPEERAMIQAVSGNQDVPVGRRRHRIGRARATRSRRASGRSSTSAGRSPSTSAGSTRTRAARSCSTSSRPTLRDVRRPAVARADRQLAAADPGASAHPASRLPRRRRQVRRDGGRRAADHAVVLREPVDGRARGVGARPAGAGQRQVRRAEGPVHPQQRRAVLRRPTRSSSRRCARSSRTAG